jgi:hypothetical protein
MCRSPLTLLTRVSRAGARRIRSPLTVCTLTSGEDSCRRMSPLTVLTLNGPRSPCAATSALTASTSTDTFTGTSSLRSASPSPCDFFGSFTVTLTLSGSPPMSSLSTPPPSRPLMRSSARSQVAMSTLPARLLMRRWPLAFSGRRSSIGPPPPPPPPSASLSLRACLRLCSLSAATLPSADSTPSEASSVRGCSLLSHARAGLASAAAVKATAARIQGRMAWSALVDGSGLTARPPGPRADPASAGAHWPAGS